MWLMSPSRRRLKNSSQLRMARLPGYNARMIAAPFHVLRAVGTVYCSDSASIAKELTPVALDHHGRAR
jgi:hypothetical protein